MRGYFVNWEDSKCNACSLSFPENPFVLVNYPVSRSSIQGRVANGGPDTHNRFAKIYDFAWLSAVKSIVLLAKCGTTRSKPTSEPFSYFHLSPICPTGTYFTNSLGETLSNETSPPTIFHFFVHGVNNIQPDEDVRLYEKKFVLSTDPKNLREFARDPPVQDLQSLPVSHCREKKTTVFPCNRVSHFFSSLPFRSLPRHLQFLPFLSLWLFGTGKNTRDGSRGKREGRATFHNNT